MTYKLQDLIDIDHFQNLQDRLNKIYSFPSSIIDNDGNILTATAWQEICMQFHRKNRETEKLCIKSDQYIRDHIHEAKPALSYRCPHGLVDNATPIIIDGVHYGNFFTGQFFLEKPDPAFFRSQARKYGFDEDAYLEAVGKVPIWSQEQLDSYLFFIKGLIEVIAESGLKKLREIENRETIEKKEKRNRTILKTAMDGFWVTDTDGRLMEVNDAYCAMSGYGEDELLTMHISDLEAVETREKVAEHLQKVILTGSDRFQSKHRRKDGTLFDVEASVQYRSEQDSRFICFIRDITDQKRSESERENTIRMLEILNAGTDFPDLMNALLHFMEEISGCEAVGIRLHKGDDFPYYVTSGFSEDFVETETHLCVEDLNGQLKRDDIGNPVLECMCGNVIRGRTDPSKPFFTRFGSFITNSTTRLLAKTSEADRQSRTRNRCNGEGYESVLLVPLRTGEKTFGLLQFNDRRENRLSPQIVAHLEKIAAYVSLSLAHRESEESRKSYEKDLQKRNSFIQTILDNLPIGLAVNYIDQGTATYINRKFEEIYGWPKQQLENIEDFFHKVYPDPEYREKIMNRIMKDIQSGDPDRMIWEGVEITRKDGEKRYISAKNIALYDQNFMISTVQDITEAKTLQAQLSQAQKMESIGRLAGGVAHDFNNMLGVILGYVELAMEQAENNHNLYSDLIEIQKAAQRSADLTHQLLAFARKQAISPLQLDLNQAVESMLKMLRRLIGENIDLVWQPAANLWPVKMDPSQINQILANLCANARDAITGVGRLTIETQNTTFEKPSRTEHEGLIIGDYVLLAVKDTGCGMDKKTLDNLFEPFFTTKDFGKGTGLGLSTVYGIVKQNKGFINVDSEPGRGSSFRIYFPRLAFEDRDAKASPGKKEASGGTETVLLVEDEPAILRMARMMLERKGYTVLSAVNPQQALETAENHSGRIDLLMTDIVMPEMNGRDLSAKIQSLHPDIKLLFMSGYTDDIIAHQGVLPQGIAFIQKPFSMADLTEKLRDVLDADPPSVYL